MTFDLFDSPLPVYWLKANGYLALFYGCYWLLLRRHTFLNLNRIYLLASVGVAGLLPLVHIPGLAWAWPWATEEPVVAIFSAEAGTAVAIAVTPEAPLLPDWPTLILWLAMAVAAGLLIRTVWRTGGLLRLIRRWPAQVLPDHTLVRPNDPQTPTFSFFRYLILNPDDAHTEAVRQHELVHIRQRHSLDVLLLEVLQALCWPNPALFGYRRAIRQVHEYLADRDALTHAATDRDTYARFLLDYAFHLPTDGLAHSFGPAQPTSPTLKQRIQMLYQQHTSRRALWKYALVLPLATALLAMTTRPEVAADKASVATLSAAISTGATISIPLAETVLVEGRVMERATRKPLQGANVVVKNGTLGTTTDADGNFRLVVPSGNKLALVASFVGFKPQEIAVKGTSGPVVMVFSLLGETETLASMPQTTPPSTSTAPINGSDEVFTVVEQVPYFPGGANAMYKFLGDNMRYPEAAVTKHKQGKVFVTFVVNTDGSLSDIQILKGIGYGCDEEAVRVMKLMPKWIPGHQSGRPVAVKYNLPINFQLEGKKTSFRGTGTLDDGTKFSINGTVDQPEQVNTGIKLLQTDTMTVKNLGTVTFFPNNKWRGNTTAIAHRFVGDQPLYLIDGIEATQVDLENLNPNRIESINVMKYSYAEVQYKSYGDKAKYGVVNIKLKKVVKEPELKNSDGHGIRSIRSWVIPRVDLSPTFDRLMAKFAPVD